MFTHLLRSSTLDIHRIDSSGGMDKAWTMSMERVLQCTTDGRVSCLVWFTCCLELCAREITTDTCWQRRSRPAPPAGSRGVGDALLWEPPTALRLVSESLVCARLLGVAGRTGATQVDHDPGSTTGQLLCRLSQLSREAFQYSSPLGLADDAEV